MPRNTDSARVYIGNSSFLIDLVEVLGMSIAGEAAISNEPILGTRDEDAEAHSAMNTISLATVYDSANLEALRARTGQRANVAILTPNNFEIYPLDVPGMPRTNPINAPKTSSFSMGQAARGRYGTSQAVQINGANKAVPLDGVVGRVFVIIESISGNPTTLDLGTTSQHADVPRSVGIHAVNVPAAGRTAGARLLASGGSSPVVTGWILAGDQQPLANGAL